MIFCCPFCGQMFGSPLSNGIAFCPHCSRIVESTLYQKLLGAAQYVKKFNCYDIERLKWDQKLSDEEAILVNSFIVENCYSVQEFSKVLKDLGIEGC